MIKKAFVLLLAISLLSIFFATGSSSAEDATVVIGPVAPGNNETISTATPVIIAEYSASAGIDPTKVKMTVDGVDVTTLESRTAITQNNITYVVKDDMALRSGQHNVTVSLTDRAGSTSTLTWTFYIDTTTKAAVMQQILFFMAVGAILFAAALGGAILVLGRLRHFSLRRHLITNPLPSSFIYLGIPALVSIYFMVSVLAFFEGARNVSVFLTEYVMIIGFFVLLLPYALHVQREKKKRSDYERAFSQFLYEMADAMRGGIDPSKALIELSKVDTSILKKHLKIAANSLEIGRPFEDVIEAMVRPIDSKLIKRYASLIGESAKIGGEVSQVVHRAAKDMDDLIKIEQDRTRELSVQASTIYISFGVLLVIIYLLISMYPTLGSANFGNIFGTSSNGLSASSDTTSTASKMSYTTLKERFLDLSMVTGLGSGLIIGLFTNGKMKYGLLHGLAMMLSGALFLLIMVGG